MGLGSDSEPVKVTINDLSVYLADSMQFCLEIGARLNSKGAYYIMPSFRGEPVDRRHLNEFTHSEVEIRGALEDVMNLAEAYIKFLIQGVLDRCPQSITAATGTTQHMTSALNKEFARISFREATKILQDIRGALRHRPDGVIDITPEGEQYLTRHYDGFVWLTHLPWKLVPFYQSRNDADPEYSNSADLLVGIGEILGSGQRVYGIDELDESMTVHQVDPLDYEWYRQMHADYPIQTSGFGLGIERFMLWLLQHDDIRDCTLLLRNHGQVTAP
jgi:asparaginyl-tRNA synthetase